MDIIKLKKLMSPFTTDEKYVFAVKTKSDLTLAENEEFIKNQILKYFDKELEYEIVFIGNLKEFKHIKSVVTKFKKRDHNKNPYYRNYCVSIERQKHTMSYINVCEDSTTSFNTVITALGSTHGAIIKIKINLNDNKDSDTIQEGKEYYS